MYFYLSIGTNIEPEKNAVKIIQSLVECYGRLTLFPFIYSEPEDISSKAVFLNSVAIISSPDSEQNVKDSLNKIETKLGRQRDDPLRGMKDRTADIDILLTAENINYEYFFQFDKHYIKAPVLAIGKQADLSLYGLASFQGATTIDLDASTGNIRVFDYTDDRLVNRQKSPLSLKQSLV